jgi:hypothetical protein
MSELDNMTKEELKEYFKKQIPKRLKFWYTITGRKRKIDEIAEDRLFDYYKFLMMMSGGFE